MTEKSSNSGLAENYRVIKENIRTAALKSGRNPDDIILLAATKTVSPEIINEAIDLGVEYIGENRVQELLSKDEFVNPDAHRHFIGHLQTNKVKSIVDKVEMIESVGSLHLAQKIDAECKKIGKVMDVLLEVNIGNEESKSGFLEDELYEAYEKATAFANISVKGIMAIPPKNSTNEQTQNFFSRLYDIFIDISGKKTDNSNVIYLSMGMSDDYMAAIECGANIVRIGTALFGKRNYTEREN